MNFKDRERNKLLIKIVIFFIAFFLFFILISFNIKQLYQKRLYHSYNIIISNIHKNYPELEEEIIRKIFRQNLEEKSILKEYGINENNINFETNHMLFTSEIYVRIGIGTTIFLGILCFILLRYLKLQDQKIEKLTDYTNQVLSGNYKLRISDNDESSLSILENRIYDMTVMLKEKNDFLRNDKQKLEQLLEDISHQMKTPLTSINLLNELLYQEIPEERRKEFLDNMQNELKKIEWLIKNLLYLAKLDAKMLEFKIENKNVAKLLQESINEFSILAEVNHVNIHVNCEDNITINCDPKWTKEAINNLIKNSIEHLAKNIQIIVKTNYLYTQIEVIDDGEGIKREDLKNIFKRFYKAKNSKSSSLGLGLAFVKGIIENQNGTINVKSKRNEYTKFIIKIYKVNAN